MRHIPSILLASALVAVLADRAESSTIAFDFLTPASQATIGTVYSEWAFIPAGALDAATVSVTGGQLRLGGDRSDPTQFQLLTAPAGSFTLTVDLGAFPGDGSRNVGLQVGQNEIVFHPGYPGTALRVEGPGGFANVDVGFTLAANVLHHFTLSGDGLGLFTVTLTDGLNAANSYTAAFSNGASVGGLLSITRASVAGVYGEVFADNFVLTDSALATVPEPSSLLLCGSALAVLARRLRRTPR